MKVAVMPYFLATFFTTYLYLSRLSAITTSGVELHVDLGLAGGRHLVMLGLDHDPHLLHLEAHLGADVLLRVVRRNREVAFLVADLVAEVRAALAAPRVPRASFESSS